MRRLPSRFYPIIDPAGRADRDHLALAEAVLAAGARLIQLRVKDRGAAEFVAIARKLRQQTRAAGALLIINDRVDIALLVGADGVHLGQTDLPIAEARTLLGPDAILGLSTHDLEQVEAAQASGADYIGFGPVFATRTKENPDEVQGVERLEQACRLSRLPVVAIGGIQTSQVPAVLASGASAVAMIGEISHADDPRQRVIELMQLCDS